jgi:hypothetical protein
MKEKIITYVAKRCSSILDIAEGDNMPHIAGKLAPLDRLNTIFTEAIQIQQELWFQVSVIIIQHFVFVCIFTCSVIPCLL